MCPPMAMPGFAGGKEDFEMTKWANRPFQESLTVPIATTDNSGDRPPATTAREFRKLDSQRELFLYR